VFNARLMLFESLYDIQSVNALQNSGCAAHTALYFIAQINRNVAQSALETLTIELCNTIVSILYALGNCANIIMK